MIPNHPFIAQRVITIWHIHLGERGDPKAMSTVKLDPLRTCVAENEFGFASSPAESQDRT